MNFCGIRSSVCAAAGVASASRSASAIHLHVMTTSSRKNSAAAGQLPPHKPHCHERCKIPDNVTIPVLLNAFSERDDDSPANVSLRDLRSSIPGFALPRRAETVVLLAGLVDYGQVTIVAALVLMYPSFNRSVK